jgi:hypothetical protein
MKEKFIPKISTPRIPSTSDQPSSLAHKEAHASAVLNEGEALENEISVTRTFILDKYSIPPENVLIFSPLRSKKPQRKIRAFSILSNLEKPEQNFYAEGHTAHAALNQELVMKFGSKMGVKNYNDLVDQVTFTMKAPWVMRKGFLDPLHNGFRGFPAIRRELVEQFGENKELNGVSTEEVHQIAKGKLGLPNWFLSGDTSSGK